MSSHIYGMFKPYDIRTKHQNLSDSDRERLYNAVAYYYKECVKVKSVVICRDARLYVPLLAEGFSNALTKSGIDVLINPLPVSTCQFYYTCMKNRTSGGLMLTASHNPGEYVGIKLMGPDVFPIAYGCGPEGGIKKIEELFNNSVNPQWSTNKGKKIVVNELENYINYCMNLSGVKEGDLSGLKIMLEFLSGSAGTEVSLAFQRAGAYIEMRNIVPDGFFPSGDPNPIIETSIAPARKAMADGNFDIGFCFDGDGDRMDIMDSTGSQIVPGLNMSVILPSIMNIYGNTKKDFYADVKAIPVSLCEIAKKGANVHIIRNGHSFIKEKLRENCCNGYFACEEESAHYYMNFPYEIGKPEKGYAAFEATLFFALLTAKCYKENPKEYKRLTELQNSIYRVREWPLYCESAPEKMQDILDDVQNRMTELGAYVVSVMDDGSDLDATLMRFNLPEKFDSNSDISKCEWAQVAQRISRSEDAMVRWEIVSNNKETCDNLNLIVRSIADKYVKNGFARY